ncbi:MAG: hypothetical protein AAB454_01370 [Patescibacteria group bacterium]
MPSKQITKILFFVLMAAVLYGSLAQPLTSFAQAQEVQTVRIEGLKEAGTSCGFLEIWCYLTEFFNWVAIQIGLGISYIGALLITIAAAFIQVLVEVSRTIISNQMILTGFKITLSVTNLGFVLAIVVIAFSTILRFQTYGAKQLLWKLIVAAVLVNFSLTIASVLIDFANVIGMSFVDASSGGNINSFAANLANSLNIQETAKGAGFGSVVEGYFKMLASITLTAIFNLLLVVVFFALAFMMLIRNIYLMILIILMPIVWLLWIFPNLSGHWSKWWSNFIRWTFFFPAMMFFVYVSIFASKEITTTITNIANGTKEITAASNLAGEGGIGTENNFIASVLATLAKMGILVGGLIAANSLGINGASAAMGIAKGAKNWAVGKVGKLAIKPVTAAGAAAGKPLAQKLSNLLTKPGLRWIPGAKGAAAQLAEAGTRSKEVEEYQKNNLNSLTPAQREQVYKGGLPIGAIAKSAVLASAAKEGKLKQLLEGENLSSEQKEKRLNQFVTAAKQTHPGMEVKDIPEIKDIKNTNIPLFAKITGQNIKDIVEKTAPKDIAKQSAEVLANPEFLATLNNKQIEQAAKTGVTAILNQFKTGLEALKIQQPNHPNIPLIAEGIMFQGKKPKEQKPKEKEEESTIVMSSEVSSRPKEGKGLGINKENL